MSEKSPKDAGKARKKVAQPQKKTKRKPGARKRTRPSPHASEQGEPVLSGRMVIALALALGMSIIPASGLGRYITKTSPKTAERATWVVGQSAKVHLTVVTSDYKHLACADTRKSGEKHCEFENDRERWPTASLDTPVDDNKAKILQPYRTTDRNLMLLAGLWAQPEVATRLHNEPPQTIKKGKLARFVVACDVKFIEEWDNAQIRWKTSERWSAQGKAMVAELITCDILEDGAH